ncbi:MAG: hypothetical protein GF308_19800 [Candidatus Heimdallarchaeota archaeon]|nr:hypothetical protein [Candidatus Heimdallarchaeota archaeon]
MTSLGQLAVDKAIELGMSEAEAFIHQVKNIRVEFASEIHNLKTTESLGLGLRVANGKKTAMHSTSILTKEEVIKAVKQAVKIAKVTPEDPHWNHFNKIFAKTKIKGNYDKELNKVSYDEIVDKITTSINAVKDYNQNANLTRGSLDIIWSTISVVNNYQEMMEQKNTFVSTNMFVKVMEGGESTGSEHKEARAWKDIQFEQIAEEATKKAIKFQKAKSLKSQKMPVIFKNELFPSFLRLMIGSAINADSVQKGRSPLANKIDKETATQNVTLIDDGTLADGFGTKSFDAEGYPTQKLPIIVDGILRNFIYDSYTALKENKESTGNAQRRGYASRPSPGLNNLILEPGTASLEEMVQETKKGLFIESTIGEWLSKPTSGELNATVTHGLLIEDGECTEPVKGVIIAGNFWELLKNGFEIIGKDLRNSGRIYSPSVKLAELTIAGK